MQTTTKDYIRAEVAVTLAVSTVSTRLGPKRIVWNTFEDIKNNKENISIYIAVYDITDGTTTFPTQKHTKG